MMTFYNNIDLY